MVENLTTRAVLKDKLSGAATDILSKLDHTVQNLGKSKPTEAAPVNYKVTHKGGALVRSGYETTTSQVHQLAAGESVTIVELVGRRARIIAPVEGWVSVETKDGVQIMKPCTVQRKAQQNEAFEHMFEQKFSRLKAQQGTAPQTGGYDPRVQTQTTRTPSRSPSPGSYGDSDREDTRRRGRGAGEAGGRQAGGSKGAQSSQGGGFVPFLSAPGSASGPVVLAPPGASRSSPAGGAAPAAPASATSDLLSMDEPQPAPGGAQQPQQQPAFDPFADFPAGSSAMGPPAAAGPAAACASAQNGFGDFDAFQSGQPQRGMAGNGGMAAQMNPGMAAQMNPGMMPMQQQQPMMGAFQSQGMGWQGGQAGMGAGQGSGWAAAGQQQFPAAQGQPSMGFGMGAAMPQSQMGMGMGPAMQGQMAPGMGMAQGSQLQNNVGGAFAAGSAASSANAGFAPFAAGSAPSNTNAGFGAFGTGPGGMMPMQGAGQNNMFAGGAPTAGGVGDPFGAANPSSGANVEDLMSRAMQGVANMSFEQRRAVQPPSQQGPGVPMSQMTPRTR